MIFEYDQDDPTRILVTETVTETIHRDSETITVDCTPVRHLLNSLSRRFRGPGPRNYTVPADAVQQLLVMDREQLLRCASEAISHWAAAERLYGQSFGRQHERTVQDMRRLRELAAQDGRDLWPELDEE